MIFFKININDAIIIAFQFWCTVFCRTHVVQAKAKCDRRKDKDRWTDNRQVIPMLRFALLAPQKAWSSKVSLNLFVIYPCNACLQVYNDIKQFGHERLSVFKKKEIPERWFYKTHKRIPPILLVADSGWYIVQVSYTNKFTIFKQDVLVKHRCLWRQQSQNLQVFHFYPAPPQGHVMSVRCEQPLDELTVQVWYLLHHTKL